MLQLLPVAAAATHAAGLWLLLLLLLFQHNHLVRLPRKIDSLDAMRTSVVS